MASYHSLGLAGGNHRLQPGGREGGREGKREEGGRE